MHEKGSERKSKGMNMKRQPSKTLRTNREKIEQEKKDIASLIKSWFIVHSFI